ncbi:hypothetical protein [Burkholderia sp. AU38729]|uniref:hypothetical protein n=1 Tax=Burkholderia sp. AU38729 TaxID=2879633 RepID=UPI001CF1D043|nr:hypothetical protein [Burkholderia sp. AU38729]MCA8067534.1 hypothetical protein [Burkholderia sp. AU38729]
MNGRAAAPAGAAARTGTYDESAKIERREKDARKAFVEFAGKMRDSRGFPLIFNGSDSEKRCRLPILELTAPLAIGPDQD